MNIKLLSGANDSFSQNPNVVKNYIYNVASGGTDSYLQRTDLWDIIAVKVFDDTKTLTLQGLTVNYDILVVWLKDYEAIHDNYISASRLSLSGTANKPQGAVFAILDIPHENITEEGYKNMRVLQEGAGANRYSLKSTKEQIVGNFFTFPNKALREGGTISESSNLFCTDFLPITGVNSITLYGGWRNSNAIFSITPMSFYDRWKNYLGCYLGDLTTDGIYKFAPSDLPSGTKFIRCCVNTLMYPSYTLYGVDLASISDNYTPKNNFENEASKEGSFSGELFIDPDHLASITSGGDYNGYDFSSTYDAGWVYLYEGAKKINITGAVGTLIAWFDDKYPSSETFIGQSSFISGSKEIPVGAVLGIIDFKKNR